MIGIDLWFPTSIYYAQDIVSEKYNNELKEISINLQNENKSGGVGWYGDVYTTHSSSIDIRKIDAFKPLLKDIKGHVESFAKEQKSFDSYTCNSAWINVSKINGFQEYHTHENSIISAIYYIATPDGSGKTVFKDPKMPDMFPLKNLKQRNGLSFNTIEYTPEERKLILFRSFVPHMVEQGKNINERITLAANYD